MYFRKMKGRFIAPSLLSLFLMVGMLGAPLSFGDDGTGEAPAIEQEDPAQPSQADVATDPEAPPGSVITVTSSEPPARVETTPLADNSSPPPTLTTPQPALAAPAANPEPLPTGFTTDSHGFIAYGNPDLLHIGVRGLYEGKWIETTFSGIGYFPVVRIGDKVFSAKYNDPAVFTEMTGLAVTPKASISSDGKAVFVRYELTNVTDRPITFDFAIAGDIQIDRDDKAGVTIMPDNRGFIMTGKSTEDGRDGSAISTAQGPSLAVFFAGTAGVDTADGVWLGDYRNWTFFTNQQNDLTGIDSAFSVFWLARTLGAEEKIDLGIGVAAGEMAASDALPPDTLPPDTLPPDTPPADVDQTPAETAPNPPAEAPKATPGKVTVKDATPKTGDNEFASVALMIMVLALGAMAVGTKAQKEK